MNDNKIPLTLLAGILGLSLTKKKLGSRNPDVLRSLQSSILFNSISISVGNAEFERKLNRLSAKERRAFIFDFYRDISTNYQYTSIGKSFKNLGYSIGVSINAHYKANIIRLIKTDLVDNFVSYHQNWQGHRSKSSAYAKLLKVTHADLTDRDMQLLLEWATNVVILNLQGNQFWKVMDFPHRYMWRRQQYYSVNLSYNPNLYDIDNLKNLCKELVHLDISKTNIQKFSILANKIKVFK